VKDSTAAETIRRKLLERLVAMTTVYSDVILVCLFSYNNVISQSRERKKRLEEATKRWRRHQKDLSAVESFIKK